jgi:hypothetical protein
MGLYQRPIRHHREYTILSQIRLWSAAQDRRKMACLLRWPRLLPSMHRSLCQSLRLLLHVRISTLSLPLLKAAERIPDFRLKGIVKDSS